MLFIEAIFRNSLNKNKAETCVHDQLSTSRKRLSFGERIEQRRRDAIDSK